MSARSFRRESERRDRRRERRERLRGGRVLATGALVGATALLGPAAANATTFNVDNTADTTAAGACDDGTADDCSLRQAIDDANTNSGPDVVSLSTLSGEITLTNGELAVTGDVTIHGPGAAALTISGDANSDGLHQYYDLRDSPGNGDSRIFRINVPSATTGVEIDGLTLSGGTAPTSTKYFGPSIGDLLRGGSGGAIASYATPLTISDSTLSGNEATADGGAIYAQGAVGVTLDNTTFTSDVAFGEGAGVYLNGNSLNLADSTITGNQTQGRAPVGGKYNPVGSGGGVGGRVTSAQITNTKIGQNDAQDVTPNSPATASGGGAHLLGAVPEAPVTISDSELRGNTAVGAGGGLYASGVDLDVSDTTVSVNRVDDDGDTNSGGRGGGMAVYGNVQLTRTTVGGNSASATASSEVGGGGIDWAFASNGDGLSIGSSTISGNHTNGPGGGVRAATRNHYSYDAGTMSYIRDSYSGPVTIDSSTIASNSASGAGGVYEYAYATTGYTTSGVSLTSTIAGQNSPGDLGSTGQTSGFELDHSLVQSSLTGIPFTESPAGSNVLGANPQLGALGDNGGPTATQLPAQGSPAIDAGVANSLSTDQRGSGFPRTIDQPGVANRGGSDGTDIGAVESALPTPGGGGGGGIQQPSAPVRKKCKKHKRKHGHKSAQAAKKKCKKKKKRK